MTHPLLCHTICKYLISLVIHHPLLPLRYQTVAMDAHLIEPDTIVTNPTSTRDRLHPGLNGRLTTLPCRAAHTEAGLMEWQILST